MNPEATTYWRVRVGLILSLIIGLAWGLLFGWFQIRVNASLSPWLVVFVGMPGAFFGSMIVGVVHKRMLLSWPSIVRLLIALFTVILGMPVGWLWGLLENGYDPFQLAHETSASFWQFEWLMLNIGVAAGIWHLWTLPFLRLFGRVAAWVFSGPLSLVAWVGNQTADGVGRVGQFFIAMFSAGRGATKHITGFVSRTLQRVGTLPERLGAPPETNHARRPRRTAVRRTRQAQPARTNGRSDELARVTGIVEDRCPYCSDIVKRNDPRGIKVCEVCGAPHHADCWAITGKCQVPHLNT